MYTMSMSTMSISTMSVSSPDDKLSENIWFVWSKTSNDGDKWRCHHGDKRTNNKVKTELVNKLTKDCWLSQFQRKHWFNSSDLPDSSPLPNLSDETFNKQFWYLWNKIDWLETFDLKDILWCLTVFLDTGDSQLRRSLSSCSCLTWKCSSRRRSWRKEWQLWGRKV